MKQMITYNILQDDHIRINLGDKVIFTFTSGVDEDACLKGGKPEFATQLETISLEQIKIMSTVSGKDTIGWAYPVFDAKIHTPEAVFRQGYGIGGPSGFVTAEQIEKENIIYSYGMIVLKYEDGYLALYGDKHDNYENRFDIRADRRNGLCFRITAGFNLEETNKDACLPSLYLYWGENLEQVLYHVALAIAAPIVPPVPDKPAYNWCSWYYYYNNLDIKQLREFLEGLKDLDTAVPIKYVQIDAGYFPSAGDWLDSNTLWPGGLREAFDLIRLYGYMPGIWIAPYMVGSRSKLFSAHSDWMLRSKDGKLVTMWKWYNEPKVWGYQDEEYYVLDTSHPDAMEYLKNVFATLRAWGAEFFKTDFMLWGIQHSTEVRRHITGLTSVQYYRQFMEVIRKEIGDSYWLGCIAPFLPSLGYVNGMRIAGDVGAKWDGTGFGPEGMIRESIADYYFNGVYWQNDPDAMILRDFHVFLKEHEILSLCLMQALSGGMVYTSDPLGKIAPERLKLFRLVQPDVIRKPHIPFIDRGEELVVVLHHRIENGRHIIFLFNPTDKVLTAYYEISEIAGIDCMYTQQWNTGKISAQKMNFVAGRIPAHDCLLIFGDENLPVDGTISNLWNWGF